MTADWAVACAWALSMDESERDELREAVERVWAYRAARPTDLDHVDPNSADFWFLAAVNVASGSGLSCSRCTHPIGTHWPDDQRSRPGCQKAGCLCSWCPQEVLMAVHRRGLAALSGEPRTWALPDEPTDVTEVRDQDGRVWVRSIPGWMLRQPDGSFNGEWKSWASLVVAEDLTEATAPARQDGGDRA